jgi:hypothetical protein
VTIHIRNLEWLDHNSQRSYPLTVEATKKDTTESFELPDDFIVAMALAIGYGVNVDPSKFFISDLNVSTTGFGITIGYAATSGTIKVATANIARSAYEAGQTYRLTGLGNFIDSTGHIQLGYLDNIDKQPAGPFVFAVDDTRIEPDVVNPMIRTLSSVRVENGGELSNHLYGTITLSAGTNIRITVVETEGQDPEIVIDAIDGEGLSDMCICIDDQESPPIRTINRIPGTTDGDFTILGNSCLVPKAITNGLRLEDVCSEPCCGCTELETVTQQLEQFGSQATTLENFLVDLQARVTQMDQVVLGARLGDRGCITCEE